MRKTETNYCLNLDEKDITTRNFGKLSSLSYLINSDKIHLNENGELIKMVSLKQLSNFFSNRVKDLKIPEYENLNPIFENVKDPVFKAILKYKNHPSIIAI